MNSIDALGLCDKNDCIENFLRNNYGDWATDHIISNFSITSYLPGSPNFWNAWQTTAELGAVKGGLIYGAARAGNYMAGRGISQGAYVEALAVSAEGLAVVGVGLSAFSTMAELIAYEFCTDDAPNQAANFTPPPGGYFY